MSDIVLMLGPIAFQDFEVPSGITFGGAQRLAVHRLVGGTKVIDVLGRDDAQIVFSGIFSGPDATWRARTLDELRTAGLTLPLTWDVFFYSVIISGFQADYCNGWWIPYRIVCAVLRDEAAALIEPIASLAASVVADISAAAGQVPDSGIDFSPVQSAFTAPDATVRGTADYSAGQSSLVMMQSTLNSTIGAAEATLISAEPSQATSPDDGVARLLCATDAAGRLGALTTARAYIGRAAVNLTNAST